MSRCKECNRKIKWIETEQGWRRFDPRKRGETAYRPHECKKKKVTADPPPRLIPNPWWID